MMKFIVTILTAIYLVASTGTSISMHYCMGKLVDWTFNNNQKDLCKNCGMAASEGCCSDDHVFVKNTDDQKTTATVHLILSASASLPATFIDNPERIFTSLTEDYPPANAPPRKGSVPVYLRNCVFLI